jgi:outer membrane protein assembly factor BamB
LFCIDPTKTGDVSPEIGERPGKGKLNPNSAVVWEFTENGPKKSDQMHRSISSVAVHNGLVIAADFYGYLHCLDEKTGKRFWSHDLKGQVTGNPLVVDEKVFAGDDNGDVQAFALQKTKKLIAKNELDAPVRAPPVFANGVLYVLTEKTLFALAQKP